MNKVPKQNKIFCGSGKKQNDSWITATINVEKIKDHIQEYKGVKFVRIDINIKDETDQYGKDVAITINEYNPKGKVEVMPKSGDLPF